MDIGFQDMSKLLKTGRMKSPPVMILNVIHQLQLPTFAYARLLNKPYKNEVTLTGQDLP